MPKSSSDDRPTSGTGGLPTGDLDAAPSGDGSMAVLLGAVARAPSSRPPLDLTGGTIVDDTYRLVGPIGAGGMGVVYLARDVHLQRDVALKVHRAASAVDRLQREAVAMAQLAHPNVLTVHAVGLIEGRLYVAMEYVPGQTFRAWCTSKKRSWREIVTMLIAAGQGLAAAHDAGFVHRDFKPENVLVGNDGRPRVGDFGLVRATEGASRDGIPRSIHDETDLVETSPGRSVRGTDPVMSKEALAETMDAGTSISAERRPATLSTPMATPIDVPLTVTGAALGTPAYMAPEQFAAIDVDARADQFAFCIVLYEALCGHRPYRGQTYGELKDQVVRGEPEPLPRGVAPSWLARVIRRGMARAPADRFPDLHALLAELRAAPRRRARIAIGGAALLAAGGVTAALLLQPDHAIVRAPGCDHASLAIDAVWTKDRASTLTTHAAGWDQTGRDYMGRIVDTLDRWADRYRTAAEQACKATRVDHSWSPHTAAESTACQRRALDDLRSYLDQVDTSTRDEIPVSASSAHSLDYVEDCVDERVLSADYQMPGDPAIADAVQAAERELTEIERHLDHGDLTALRAELESLRSRTAPLDFAPLQAEIMREDGMIAYQAHDYTLALDRLEKAYAMSRQIGAEGDALDTSRMIIWIHSQRDELDAARQWIVQAQPEAERYGLRHGPAAAVFQAAAVVYEKSADYDHAIELERRLVDALRNVDDMMLAGFLGDLGSTMDAAGHSTDAIAADQEALGIFARAYGPDDARAMYLRNNLIVAKVDAGDLDGAIADAEEALALLAHQQHPDSEELTQIRFNYAFALQTAGRNDEAISVYQQVRDAYVTQFGVDSPDVADVDANLGDLMVDAGHAKDGVPYLQHALGIRKATLGVDHDETADVLTHLGGAEMALPGGCAKAAPYYQQATKAYRAVAEKGGEELGRAAPALLGLGDCADKAGHHDEALRDYTEARRLANASDSDRRTRYGAAWSQGWALANAGRTAEAKEALTAARGLLHDDDLDAAKDGAAIDTWLAHHP